MSESTPADDLIPISRLGDGSKIVRDVVQTGRPRVVTEEGVGVAIILDIKTYESMREESAARALFRDLVGAVAEADSDELVPHETVVAAVRDRFAGQVSASTRRQLEAL